MKNAPITIDDSLLSLLEKLCNAVAVSGAEAEVRRIVLEEVKEISDEVSVDALGNVLVRKFAKKDSATALNVMLDAHMDEVGFMVADDERNGSYAFEIVGGIDSRQLPGKQVWMGRDHLPGVIGTTAVHLLEDDEKSGSIPLRSLRIDLGPAGAGKLKRGDYGTFATRFFTADGNIFSKALDDRIGVVILIEMLRHAPEHINLFLSFSVQEEIGLRGARAAAYTFDPDLAIAVDSTPARDLPREDGEENIAYNTHLGAGPTIYVSDAGTISDPRLIHFLEKTAVENAIPYQFRQPGKGGTNAGAIHRSRGGIPSVSISVPGRYAHSAIMLARLSDWQNTLDLVHLALNGLSAAVLEAPRE